MIEGRDVKAMFNGELGRFHEHVGPILAVAKNERAIDPDSVFAQIRKRNRKPAFHCIEALAHGTQNRGVQAFKSDQDPNAARFFQFGQENLVVSGINAHLGNPAQIERFQCFRQFTRKVDIGSKIIIDEEMKSRRLIPCRKIADDIGYGTMACCAVEKGSQLPR